MTELRLQAAICEELKRIFSKISLWDKEEMKIFEFDVPKTTEFEDEESKYLPYCIVRIVGGEIAGADEPEIVTADVYITIKDDSEDRSGHKRIIEAITRIRDSFEKNAGISGEFRLLHPLEWAMDDNEMFPYIHAALRTRWQVIRIPYGAASKYL